MAESNRLNQMEAPWENFCLLQRKERGHVKAVLGYEFGDIKNISTTKSFFLACVFQSDKRQ